MRGLEFWSVLSLVGSLASALVAFFSWLLHRKRRSETIADRVQRLSKSLAMAAEVVESIEEEVNQRYALVSRLQNEIEMYEELKDMRAPEVQAVAQVLKGELKKAADRSLWVTIGVNLAFYVLGVATTMVLNALLS